MLRETYNGRKLSVRALKGRYWGEVECKADGMVVPGPCGLVGPDAELKAMAQLKRDADFVDADDRDTLSTWGERWLRKAQRPLDTCL